MRVFSFAQESTRYCNYSKDKFGNNFTFIIPSWSKALPCELELGEVGIMDEKQIVRARDSDPSLNLIQLCSASEIQYTELLKKGCTPQQARQVLPNALKTEINMCGFKSDWDKFFALRSPKAGAKGMHPDMAVIADMIYEDMNK